MKKIILLIFVLLGIYSLPTGENPKRQLQDSRSDDIIILHTNDVHCGVQDTIGYDGLMLYKKQLLKKYKHVLLVDAGDHIQGGTIGLITNGIAIIDIMNKVGYDVATLGNHEFDYGVEQLEKCKERLSCSYISSNYCLRTEKQSSIYDPYKIVEAGNKKIGFIGVATPQTLTKTSLVTEKDAEGKSKYDFLTGNNSKELYERVQTHINDLRDNKNVDYVIILAHLGIRGDAEFENTSEGLLKNLKRVDALIDGHTHLVYSEKVKDLDGKEVPYAQTGTKLTNIGVFTLHTDGKITQQNIDEIPYDPALADQTLNFTRSKKTIHVDKEMNKFINDTIAAFSDQLNRVVGKTDFPLNVYKTGESKQSHDQMSRFGENILCNLVTDALKFYGDSDVTIMNAGSVREDINEGNITYQEVINTMPFSNDVLVKQISGQDILDALEFGVRTFPSATSRFPQVSGITYKIDISIPTSVVVDKDEAFVNVTGERRVYDVKVNGAAIDAKKNYTLSTNSFIINGGDGYSMFGKHKEVLKTSVGVDNEVLLKYIEEKLGGTIPEKYAFTEDRIVKTIGKEKDLSNDIIILHTNDVQSGALDVIGYDGLALYKKQLLTKYKNVILVDAGDHLQGGSLGSISNGEAIIDIMKKVGYDVATIGEHEFDFGVDKLVEFNTELNEKYISANFVLKSDSSPIFSAYKIIEKGGKKIAFIGVTTPQALYKSKLYEEKVDTDLKYDLSASSLNTKIQGIIDEVKGDSIKADYVILLTHLGLGGDASFDYTSEGLLRQLKNVNAVIDGHTHLVYSGKFKDAEQKEVIIAQAGSKLGSIGVLTISSKDGSFSHEIIKEIPEDINFRASSLNVTRNNRKRLVDNDMYSYILSKLNVYSEKFNEVIGKTDFPLNIFKNSGETKESKDQINQLGENNLCNLVADALLEYAKTINTNVVAAIINAGSVREDINAGNITYQEILNTMPFSNEIVAKIVKGSDILNALEFGVRSLPNATSRFPHVSGITYKINIKIPSSVVVNEFEEFVSVEDAKRKVYEVKVNGNDIINDNDYIIVLNKFMADGGDGYSMFKVKEATTDNFAKKDNEILIDHIKEESGLNGTIPDEYTFPQGRIVKTIGNNNDLSDDIVILHTNDVHCGVQDTIGYDGLMLYKKQLLTKYKHVLLVDAGDHIQGGTLGLISNGEAIIDIMNKLGYDVATLGNHEFDYGVAQLETCRNLLKCDYISTNYCFRANKSAIYPAYKIIPAGDKKIGFIGVATPQTLSKTSLITIKGSDDQPLYDFLTDNHSKELYERVQAQIDKVRNEEHADYVIILAHLGVGGDAEEENTSAGLLKNLKNVDALIDGHTHLVYSNLTKDANNKDVPFAQTGTKLTNVGVFTIYSNKTISQNNINLIPFDPNFASETLNFTRSKKIINVDNDMYNYIQAKINSFSDILNKVVGKTDFPLNVYKLGTVSKESHDQLSRTGENILCNLVTDALRAAGGADVCIMNAGSVREDILEGDITYQEIINTMPFSNDVLVKEITGQDILDALEFGVRTLPEPTSRFPQVSGITYKIDMSVPTSVVVDNDEVFVRVDGERRVYDVMVNGEQLDLEKIYTLSTNSFIIDGGDGYSMFAKHKEYYKLSLGVDNEVLLNYINITLNKVVPEKYRRTEGRIIKTNSKKKSDDIIILHTNDVHCGVQDSIGYDGLMLYKKQMLSKYNNVILVDAGDHVQGGTLGLISNGEAIIDIMNKLEYDVATLGNHEFDYGVAQLETCAKMLNCSYISTNYCYHKNKQAIYPAYKIIEAGSKKIAFIGVATPQTLSKTSLITIKDDDGNQVYDFLTENHSKELYDRVQTKIDEVKAQGVDYVIILAHLGIGGDAEEENTSAGLLRNLKNVDALIDGHTHLTYTKITPDKTGKGIPFAQTGTKLNYIGVTTIHTDGKITQENIDTVPYDSLLVDDTLTITRGKKEVYVDSEMNEYINDKINSFKEILNRVVGHTAFPLNVYELGTVNKQSHDQLSRFQENKLCNLVTDALRYYGEADITIMNAGSVREDILEGDITYQEIINTMPFSNDVLVKEITGQDILDALEFGVRTLPGATSRFPQVSGLTYKVDTSITSSVIVDNDEVFVRVGGRRRVYNVFVNGEKLDLYKKYTISTNSFIIGGGDGYSMFAPYPELKTSIGVDNEILLKYILEKLGGEIPIEYNTTQNRIYISDKKNMTNPDGTPFTYSGDGFITADKLVFLLVLLLL